MTPDCIPVGRPSRKLYTNKSSQGGVSTRKTQNRPMGETLSGAEGSRWAPAAGYREVFTTRR